MLNNKLKNSVQQSAKPANKKDSSTAQNRTASQRAALGHWAEQQAAEWLQQKGWQIVAQNFHSRYGELDVVAVQGQDLVLLEVKARSAGSYAMAQEVVSRQKQHRLIKTSMVFLQQHPQFIDYAVRFDVMCFDFAEKIAKTVQQDFAQLRYDVQWIENAFTLDFESVTLATDLW